MITLRPFTRADWYGYAGASSFDDGSEPLSGSFTIGDGSRFTCDVVLDANGLGLHVMSLEGDTFAFVHFEGLFAARAVCALHDGVTMTVILAMPGVERCDGGEGDIDDEYDRAEVA